MNRLGHSIRNLLCFYVVFLPCVMLGDLNNGLVAWYPFDGNASDMSGNGNHGTVYGATLGTDRHGQVGKAYHFDGDDWIQIPHAEEINFQKDDPFSITLWVKSNTGNTELSSIIEKWQGGGSPYPYVIRYKEGGTYNFARYDSSSSNSILGNNDIFDQSFTQLAISGDGESFSSFINGVLDQSVEVSGGSITNNKPLYIGRRGGNMPWFFHGSIDDIRIYDRALSVAEVLALYNMEKPKIPLTDSNFQAAVNLWFSDEANATATYGHISDWNTSSVTDMDGAFNDRSAFNENISTWDLSNVTNTRHMFKGATSFNQDIGNWNTSKVTTMHGMFQDASSFNQSIEDWNTSEVKWMGYMFSGATSFNQPLGDWNVSSIVTMVGMFDEAESFNQAIGDWNTSTVTDMRWMFLRASSFNQPIGSWDLSNVVQLNDMFKGATAFNQPIGDWNVSSVTGMSRMFYNASSFNQNLGNWDVSSVTNMEEMFRSAALFNQNLSNWNLSTSPDLNMTDMFLITPALSNFNKGNIHEAFSTNQNWPYDWRQYVVIDNSNFQTAVNLWFDNQAEANATYGHISDWNTSAVTNMANAFKDRTNFNEDIGNWDVSNVTNMSNMFRNTTLFNQDIGDWDTSNVTNMGYMFHFAWEFNQPIGDWDTTAVTSMAAMFREARAFNQNISDWNTSSVTTTSGMFYRAHEFNQNIGGWDVSSVIAMSGMFLQAYALSSANKGLIHESFSSNPNWAYDWHTFVSIDDSNFHNAVDLWFDNQAEANATYGHISDWNTSAVTDMSEAFKDRSDFNEDISKWDVSKVTNMKMMFRNAHSFNQPIGDWDISSVTNMKSMFFGAESFNQPIGNWNTSNVVNMREMFWKAFVFDQPINDWNTSSVMEMNLIFRSAIAFNQDISNWNVSSVNDFEDAFFDSDSMSNQNKGLIHEAFSFNPNWPYDWSEFVSDSNSSPSDDHNQTESSQPDSIVLAPMVATYGHQRDENNMITLHGKIRSGGNGTIEQLGFYVRTSLDGNDTVLLADNLSDDDSFSITFSSKDSFYFQALARNEKGETKGTWKRVGATMQSYPFDGVVETGDGWSTSEWFGDFRYFENGWAYHYGLGWIYLSADREDGMWLWRKEHGWLWSNQEAWPFLWSHASGDWIYLLIRAKQDPLFFDYSTGRYGR